MQQENKTSRQIVFTPVRALAALAIALAPTLVHAQTQSGTLDASFGTGGKATASFAAPSSAGAAAVQPDGKLVAAGAAVVNGQVDFALARYNSDGTLDTSFGSAGLVTTDLGGRYESATALALQSDGKIVLAGGSLGDFFNDFALARYNSDGTLDTGFGTGGTVITKFENSPDGIAPGEVSAQAYSVAVQPDGKIVVAGVANIEGEEDFALVRYNADGTLDDSFGAGGKVTTDFGHFEQGFSYAFGNAVAVQLDGKIVVAGQAFIDGTSFDVALARYESDGTLDWSFGTGGKVTTDFGSRNDVAFSVAALPDGTIVVAGQGNAVRGLGFALVRYTSSGTLDDSFGEGGIVTTDFGIADQGFSLAYAASLAVEPDGRIVAAGRAYFNGGFHSGLARYISNGTLDASFGTGGKVTVDFQGPYDYDEFTNVVVQPDGKIVATVAAQGNFTLVRYNN